MKKYLVILAALAFAAVSCNKAEQPEAEKPYSSVKVHLTVTAPEANLTKANYALTDPSNPIGGFNVTWKEGDRFHLIIFQGDNANWKDNYIYQEIILPAAAEGQTTYDLSLSPLDLSGFDSSKNLKYAVVYSDYGFNTYWHTFNIWNGISYYNYNYTPSQQINDYMFAETDVQEVAFPSGDLTLSGKLHWMSSVLAVQYDIDPAADITYPSNSILLCELTTPSPRYQVDCYFPITRQSDEFTNTVSLPITFGSAAKLSDALDANNCRYYVIPSDAILDPNGDARSLCGASVSFRQSSPSVYFTSSGTLSSVTIEPGLVYGIRVKVTDSDSDGVPEFAKL